jgi:8-oxo-dGTP pyrophosphatase MutT (NUDIX family)
MEPHGDRNDSPLLPSATVLMLRDGPHGLEVFLMRRHGLSDVLGGAYVFPGGKADAEDAQLVARLDQDAKALHQSLGEPELEPARAASVYVAAVREVFEETGVLYAPIEMAAAHEAWLALRAGRSFAETVHALDIPLQAAALAPWSRWITPLVGGVVRKRFDTRFFVAAVPAGQQPAHDDHEATASLWLAPHAALQQYWAGEIQLAPPQIMSLAHLARHSDVASVLAEARGRRPPTIRPEPFELDGMRVLCYPGDARHSERERAMPGPTRLCWRNQRFEPQEGGLQALLPTSGAAAH